MAAPKKKAKEPKAKDPEIPLNERPGRCRKCGGPGHFTLAFVEHILVRTCRDCGDKIGV